MRLIDADALESDGWQMSRTVRVDKDTMEIQTRKPTDFPTIEPQRMRGKGRWNVYYHGEENGKSIFSYSCNQCGYGAPYNLIGGVCEQKKWNFCPNCGAEMRGTE